LFDILYSCRVVSFIKMPKIKNNNKNKGPRIPVNNFLMDTGYNFEESPKFQIAYYNNFTSELI